MDVASFGKELNRMCESFPTCEGCEMPIEFHGNIALCRYWSLKSPERIEVIVEKWSKDHPIKTYGQKFEEIFGKNIIKVERSAYNNKILHITLFESGLCKLWDRPYEESKED